MSADLAFVMGNCTGFVLAFILGMWALRDKETWTPEGDQ